MICLFNKKLWLLFMVTMSTVTVVYPSMPVVSFAKKILGIPDDWRTAAHGFGYKCSGIAGSCSTELKNSASVPDITSGVSVQPLSTVVFNNIKNIDDFKAHVPIVETQVQWHKNFYVNAGSLKSAMESLVANGQTDLIKQVLKHYCDHSRDIKIEGEKDISPFKFIQQIVLQSQNLSVCTALTDSNFKYKIDWTRSLQESVSLRGESSFNFLLDNRKALKININGPSHNNDCSLLGMVLHQLSMHGDDAKGNNVFRNMLSRLLACDDIDVNQRYIVDARCRNDNKEQMISYLHVVGWAIGNLGDKKFLDGTSVCERLIQHKTLKVNQKFEYTRHERHVFSSESILQYALKHDKPNLMDLLLQNKDLEVGTTEMHAAMECYESSRNKNVDLLQKMVRKKLKEDSYWHHVVSRMQRCEGEKIQKLADYVAVKSQKDFKTVSAMQIRVAIDQDDVDLCKKLRLKLCEEPNWNTIEMVAEYAQNSENPDIKKLFEREELHKILAAVSYSQFKKQSLENKV